MSSESHPPVLRIVRGQPDPDELAVIATVLAAAGTAGPRQPAAPISAWADPARLLRVPGRPGPNGWTGTALPR